tara:strand:- start:76 stop:432 length:357 start_codon:yes stop_codon:yes gene_type:complete
MVFLHFISKINKFSKEKTLTLLFGAFGCIFICSAFLSTVLNLGAKACRAFNFTKVKLGVHVPKARRFGAVDGKKQAKFISRKRRHPKTVLLGRDKTGAKFLFGHFVCLSNLSNNKELI